MDSRHTRRGGVGELPQRSYPRREPFPVMTDEQAEADAAVHAATESDRRVVQTVQRARMLNYPFTIAVSSQAAIKALSENLKRSYLFIQVKAGSSAGILYINYGSPADTGHVEIVAPGGSYEFPVVPVDSIWLTASAGTMGVVVTEGTEL